MSIANLSFINGRQLVLTQFCDKIIDSPDVMITIYVISACGILQITFHDYIFDKLDQNKTPQLSLVPNYLMVRFHQFYCI